jgi:hypothetical protein
MTPTSATMASSACSRAILIEAPFPLARCIVQRADSRTDQDPKNNVKRNQTEKNEKQTRPVLQSKNTTTNLFSGPRRREEEDFEEDRGRRRGRATCGK